MSCELIIHRAGPGITVQDMGRPGFLAYGLSRGGAADRLAIAEGAALLGQSTDCGAIELAGMGGEFEATQDLRIALTGASMAASIDGAPVVWNASHLLPKGARLSIGAVRSGVYGYLHLGGGLSLPKQLGAQSAHLAAGIGAPLSQGTRLAVGADKSTITGMKLTPDARFDGGVVRVVPSLQTNHFADADIERFQATAFSRDNRGNRMGVRMVPEGRGFETEAGLNILSEVIVPGDIQITGDGTPFVLLSECQTTGGYPRIGSVIPSDLPRVAQTQPGAVLRFKFIALEEATQIEQRAADALRKLRQNIQPLVRDPKDIADLLAYQLISGVTAGDDLERSLI